MKFNFLWIEKMQSLQQQMHSPWKICDCWCSDLATHFTNQIESNRKQSLISLSIGNIMCWNLQRRLSVSLGIYSASFKTRNGILRKKTQKFGFRRWPARPGPAVYYPFYQQSLYLQKSSPFLQREVIRIQILLDFKVAFLVYS